MTQPQAIRPSVLTLAIASVSSVVAAILASRLWGPGTLLGAAATPVVITLVGELLKRPAERITVVRGSRTGAEPLERATPAALEAGDLAPRSTYRPRRRAIVIALVTGLLAFGIGAVVLTSTELIFGSSSFGSGSGRTTILGGPAKDRSPTTTPQPDAGPTVTTQTTTETTTAPAPAAPSTSTKAPPPGPTAPPATETAPQPEAGPTAP